MRAWSAALLEPVPRDQRDPPQVLRRRRVAAVLTLLTGDPDGAYHAFGVKLAEELGWQLAKLKFEDLHQ